MRIDATSPIAALTGQQNPTRESEADTQQFNVQAMQAQAALPTDKPTDSVKSENMYVKMARQSPDKAEETAYSLVNDSMKDPLLNISSWPVIRYSVSGQLVTDESNAYFQKLSADSLKLRTDLYNSEKAKGTFALEIVEKLVALNSSLPKSFQDMANWQA